MSIDPAALRLDLLYHFHEIATQQSLKRAARRLHLTPPAVTHSLARLEAALGCTLCARGKSGFRLTEAGRRLFATTEAMFVELRSALEWLGDADQFTGLLSIGLLDDLVDDGVDAALGTVMQRHSACKLNLRVTDPDDMNRLLYQGELHAGIGIFFKHLEQLTYVPVGRQTLAYYVSERHPFWTRRRITRAHLVDQTVAWIDNEKKDNFALETEVFGPHPRYKMRVDAYSNSIRGGIHILLSGRALVPLPVPYMARFMRAHPGRVRRLAVTTNAPTFTIECAYNPKLPIVPPVRDLLRQLQRPPRARR